MSLEQNKSIVRRWVEEGWNQRNLPVIDQLYTPTFMQHEPGPSQVTSAEGLKQYVAGFQNALPDLHFTIDDLVAEGDKVTWRFTAHGTQTGTLMGIPATGREATVTGIVIFRLEGSRIAEGWLNLDVLGLMQQIGIIPTMNA